MKLQNLLIAITLSAFICAAAGGWFSYTALKGSVQSESEKQVALQAESASARFSAFLMENMRSIKAMAGLRAMAVAASDPHENTLKAANRILDLFQQSLQADVCYLLDASGTVLASSNRNESKSFVGKNYAFRPYFRKAVEGKTHVYMALGVTSGKRGVYYSHPVYDLKTKTPLGVAVIKTSVEHLESEWQRLTTGNDTITLLTDSHGLIFISSRPDWLFHLLWEIPAEQIDQLDAARQFGTGPWQWTGMRRSSSNRATDRRGALYLMHTIDIPNYLDWQVVQLSDFQTAYNHLSSPLIKIAGLIIAMICLTIGAVLVLLFRTAHAEILRRQTVQANLRSKHQILESILAASPIGIGLVENRIFRWANKALLNIFGFESQTDYEGKSTRMIYAEEGDYERIGQLLYTKASQGLPVRVDAQLKRCDGTVFTGLLTISAQNPKRPMERAIFTISDITARVEAEEEKLKKEKLQGVLETIGAVCHELNQPLMIMSGYCSLAREDNDSGKPIDKWFAGVHEQAMRIGDITRKLMSITQYETRSYSQGTRIIDIDQASESPSETENPPPKPPC